MENMNSFDVLLRYPEENGLIYESHLDEKRLYLSPNDTLLNTKYIVFKKRNLIFCAYDSYAAKVNSSQTFTGVYCPIRLNPELELKLCRKHWSDSFFVLNKRKTGVEVIDRNFTVTAAKPWNFESILSEKEAHLFLELEKRIKPLKLVIQHDYMPMIGELKGRQVIGIETNQWICQKEDVDSFLSLGEKLIDNIINACNRFF